MKELYTIIRYSMYLIPFIFTVMVMWPMINNMVQNNSTTLFPTNAYDIIDVTLINESKCRDYEFNTKEEFDNIMKQTNDPKIVYCDYDKCCHPFYKGESCSYINCYWLEDTTWKR